MRIRRLLGSMIAAVMVVTGLSLITAPSASAATYDLGTPFGCQTVGGTYTLAVIPGDPNRCNFQAVVTNVGWGDTWVIPADTRVTTRQLRVEGTVEVQTGGRLLVEGGETVSGGFPTPGQMLVRSGSLFTIYPGGTFTNNGMIEYCGDVLVVGPQNGLGVLVGNTPVQNCPCPPGSYGGYGQCDPASPGYFVASAGSFFQTACPAGTYSSTAGATACTPAPAGSFVSTTAAIEATACPVGSYSATTGATSCTLAAPGSYVDTAGATAALLCPIGTYQPASGATSCTLADAGYFVDTIGASQQTMCPTGTTSTAGASECTPVTTTDQTITFTGPASQLVGAVVPLSATATSGLDVAFTSTTPSVCSVSGTDVTTLAVGTCSIDANQAGNAAYNPAPTVTRTFQVRFAFVGFAQPVDNAAVNLAKAGAAVPVKFSLGGDQGLGIFAGGSPTSQRVGCDSAVPVDVIEETVTAGASGLKYDAATSTYSYTWKTAKAWSGTCRVLTLELVDGSTKTAAFRFR